MYSVLLTPDLLRSFFKVADNGTETCTTWQGQNGLTKREYFAAKALQGLMVQSIPGTHNQNAENWNMERANFAVDMADALIRALEKKRSTALTFLRVTTPAFHITNRYNDCPYPQCGNEGTRCFKRNRILELRSGHRAHPPAYVSINNLFIGCVWRQTEF